MIDVYASQPNYWRHLAPIVRELCRRGHEVRTGASSLGRPWGDRWMNAPRDGALMLVASWVDARRWPWLRCAYVEHGAGQTYIGGGDGYAGADRLDNVALFLTPNEEVAARWQVTYPAVRTAVVGCPALDQYLSAEQQHDQNDEQDEHDGAASDVHAPIVDVAPSGQDGPGPPTVGDGCAVDGLRLRGVPVVAVSSHWFCGVVPETMPVLPAYEQALSALVAAGTVQVLGHCHPRAWQRAEALWKRLGVPFEQDPDVVLRAADLFVCDNSSLMFEAATIGLPVLALNLPFDPRKNAGYRRDVEHGLRFWSFVPGLQCADPTEFRERVEEALTDPPEAKELRARAAARAYAHRDGRSAQRAADAIEEVL